MILVLLGTQHNEFKRLLEEVEKNIENGRQLCSVGNSRDNSGDSGNAFAQICVAGGMYAVHKLRDLRFSGRIRAVCAFGDSQGDTDDRQEVAAKRGAKFDKTTERKDIIWQIIKTKNPKRTRRG